MHEIKVILASRPKMLSDVIRNIIERQPDMILVGDVIDPIKLLLATREISVDVVIVTPLNANGEPRICSHLLAEHPQLIVVTLSSKGEAAYLYQSGVNRFRIDEPCGELIISAIRKAVG
jgi:DNA-binding NarL/FixJ family response regulator